jgi:hypothetical protein
MDVKYQEYLARKEQADNDSLNYLENNVIEIDGLADVSSIIDLEAVENVFNIGASASEEPINASPH